MYTEKSTENQYEKPIKHSNDLNFFQMYGKSMLHLYFLSCIIVANLIWEVINMLKMTNNSNSKEVAL